MAGPTELSIEEIRNFLLLNGGKVTNHDLVKHFKPFLTNSDTKDEARNTFKKYVNTLASIKNENGEKYIVLKRKKTLTGGDGSFDTPEQVTPPFSPGSPSPLELPSPRQPPPYRPPPPLVSPSSSMELIKPPSSPFHNSNEFSMSQSFSSPTQTIHSPFNLKNVDDEPEDMPPALPLRKKASIDRQNSEQSIIFPITEEAHNTNEVVNPKFKMGGEFRNDIKDHVVPVRSESTPSLSSNSERQVSVKERTQKFNKMASDGDVVQRKVFSSRKLDQIGDEDDKASVISLDQKSHDWILKAAVSDYYALVKLAAENPKLLRVKTALHWAAKHDKPDIVKLVAGQQMSLVNARSNGGYTPLHIAMQFRNERVYNLLTNVYGADPNIRDWSGKKPRQYLVNEDTSVSADTFRKIKARKKHSEKDLGFLRIGSLNMRVKKTTEAFSNFLGVGTGTRGFGSGSKMSAGVRNSAIVGFSQNNYHKDAMHKSWGSADNIQNDKKIMPPPTHNAKLKRKSAKRQNENSSPHHSRSTPGTPNQPRSMMSTDEDNANVPPSPASSITTQHDSDSDTAFGFDANWQGKSRYNK